MATMKLDGGSLARSNGSLIVITGIEEIAQKISISLQLVLGEWFLNTAEGVPYYEQIFVKNPSPGKITSIFRKAILAVPGVASIQTLTVDFERTTRKIAVRFFGTAVSGETIDFNNVFDLFSKLEAA